jgi:hypothetical protein
VTGVGILPIKPAITGPWTFQGFPEQVDMTGADVPTVFNIATWAWPWYSGVVAQYRAAVPFDAMHMLVYRDGTYVISHVDEINPDLASPLEHALVDAPGPTALACAIVGGLTGFVVGLLVLD